MASSEKLIRIILKLEDQMSSGLDKATNKIDRLSSKMKSVGTSMTLGVTAPIVAIGGAAVKSAVDWESAFTGVTKTVDGTAEQLAELEDGLRNLATNSTLAGLENAHTEIAGIAEVAGQLGVGIGHIESFTEVIGQLSMATNIAGEEGATMIAQFANVAKMPLSEIRNFGDAITTLGNNAATTEKDILSMASRLASIADVGFNPDEILAYSSALSSLGITAELGGTNFMKGVNEIAKAVSTGGDALKTIADVSDVSMAQFKKAFEEDASGAMQTFIEGLGELDRAEQLAALESIGIKGSEASRVFLSLAGNTELLAKQLDMASTAFAGNGALMEEATKRADTAAANYNKLKNNLNDLGITFGEILLPFFNKIVTGLTQVIQWFGKLPAPIQNAIVIIAGIAAAIGPVVFVIGTLVSAVTSISAGFAAVSAGVIGFIPAITALSGSFMGLAGSIFAVLAPIAPLLIALGLLAGALMWWQKSKTGEVWANNFKMLGQIIQLGTAKILAHAQKFGQELPGHLNNIGTSIQTNTQKATNALSEGTKAWGGIFQNMGQLFDKLKAKVVQTFLDLAPKISQGMKAIIPALQIVGSQIMQGLINGVKAKIAEFVATIANMAKQVAQTVRDALGIKSPSKIMMEIGQQTVAGFNKGIEAMGGINVGIPSPSQVIGGLSPAMATTGIAGGGGKTTNNWNIQAAPGTSEQQINEISRAIAKRVQKR